MIGALVAIPAALSAQAELPPQSASDNTGYGTTAAEFLLLGANARGMALGGGYAAVATDIGALYANPGALALLKRPAIQGSQLQYVAGSKLNWGGLAIPFGGGSSAIGFQISTFGFDNQPVYTVNNPNGDGSFYSVSETSVAGTLAKNFSDRFSVGISLKEVSDQLGDVSGHAAAIDFGTHFHSQLGGRAVRFAFSLSNLGTNMTYSGQALNTKIARTAPPNGLGGSVPGDSLFTAPFPVSLNSSDWGLPTIFRVALGYDLWAAKDARLTLLGEFNQMRTNRGAYGGGAEFAADHIGGTAIGVALRGSYSFNPSLSYNVAGASYVEPSQDNSAGLAYGAGVSLASKGGFMVGFDYAWKNMGILGNVNFYTVTVGW
ncbi:MAG TPA: PorV/PorQ family protein [Gemmatimonadales bacterium]|nr:PorV/PorQ family protein [Gemmatimonadales bacterium]